MLEQEALCLNLSALNMQQDNLCQSIAQALAVNGLTGECLELEMTEGILMKDIDASIQKLVELKRLGIRFSIDDFGTGYSSLSYLKRLPVDKLKIDQSFVRDITHDPNDAAITRAIIAMGKQLKLKVIAEGVEDVGRLALAFRRCRPGRKRRPVTSVTLRLPTKCSMRRSWNSDRPQTMERQFRKKAKAASASELAQMGCANDSWFLNIAMESAIPPLSARRSGVD